MAEQQKPRSAVDRPPAPPPPNPAPPPGVPNGEGAAAATAGRTKYPNPPDMVNPDQATLRDQWRFAMRQYSRWYSHAWGTAILAGGAFFALGWLIKGSNPLPSRVVGREEEHPPNPAGNKTD